MEIARQLRSVSTKAPLEKLAVINFVCAIELLGFHWIHEGLIVGFYLWVMVGMIVNLIIKMTYTISNASKLNPWYNAATIITETVLPIMMAVPGAIYIIWMAQHGLVFVAEDLSMAYYNMRITYLFTTGIGMFALGARGIHMYYMDYSPEGSLQTDRLGLKIQ